VPEYRAKSLNNVGPNQTKDVLVESFDRLTKKIKAANGIWKQKLSLKNSTTETSKPKYKMSDLGGNTQKPRKEDF
jgi:hypothetical protein